MADETTETTETLPEGGAPETPAATPSLSDAITAALEPTLPAAEPVTPPEGEEIPAEGAETEGEEEIDLDDGLERNPDGTFKAKPKTDAAKPGETPPVDDKAKKPDAVNDPIPDEIKGRTRERMQSLIATVKEKDETIAVQNQLFDSIKNTGATPEEFGAMVGYMRWVHSDKPEDLRQARDLLLSELEGISLKLGETAPGIDFLSKFPDLQEAVNNGQITVDHANELAMGRQRIKVTNDRTAAQQTQEQQTQAATAERNAAITELNSLGQTLQQTDPQYAAKHAALAPALKALGMLPPKQWKAAFMAAYKAVEVPAATPASATAPAQKPSGNQPLRANKSPSGSSTKQAGSMLDAISAAIDAAG